VGAGSGEVGKRLFEEAGIGLAATALADIVRTGVDGVEMGAVLGQVVAQALVDIVKVCVCHVAQGDAALVGDQN
jgi:hypothetical protein